MHGQNININEDLIDINNGISNHKEILKLCVADYLSERIKNETTEYVKEILFVYSEKQKYPELWDNYEKYKKVVESSNHDFDKLYEFILKDDEYHINFIEKYLIDYFTLREKYQIYDILKNNNQNYSFSIKTEDFIELSKEYSFKISEKLNADLSFFKLKLYGNNDDNKNMLAQELKNATTYKQENDCIFINTLIDILNKKLLIL